MKIILIISICTLFSLNGFAQIVDSKSSWNYLEVQISTGGNCIKCNGKAYANHQFFYKNDTVIKSKSYLKLFESVHLGGDTISYTYPAGFLRDEENHKKVYFLPERYPGSEVLLYDFTVKKDFVFTSVQKIINNADTFTRTFFSAKVLKTDSITTNGTKRLRIQFDAINSNWFGEFPVADTLEWIEGIGARQGLIYQYFGGVDLLCFKNNNETLYENNYGYDCSYAGPLVNIQSKDLGELNVYPNPAKNTINIRTVHPIHSIMVYRITGEKVVQYTPDAAFYQLDLKHWASGIYIMNIDNNFKKIIIE